MACVLFTSGCGLPGALKKRAQALDTLVEQTEVKISGRQKAYAELEKKSDFIENYLKYASREAWADSFVQAKSKLNEAKMISKDNLSVLLKKNSKKDIAAVEALLGRMNDLCKEATRLSMHPDTRQAFISQAKEQSKSMADKASGEMSKLKPIMGEIQRGLNAAKEKHPARKDAIEARFLAVNEGFASATASRAVIEKEMASQSPDHAFFGDACVDIERNFSFISQQHPILMQKLAELDKTYSKTLIDMKADYFITIGRVSWEEAEYIEHPRETEFEYNPVQVDDKAFEYFSNWPDEDNVAVLGGWGGFSVKVEKDMWNTLALDPQENWPPSDNQAEFFIKETPMGLFHKYRITENKIITETGWVKVDEAFFEANEDNLGMDLFVKPFGYFEDESIKTAAPQGMAYVGNRHYGRWSTGSNGLSFWEFYGMYSLLNHIVGTRYSRPEYDTWSRDYRGRKPYYGPEKEQTRYGSGGSHTRVLYSGSNYSRTGGFRRMDQSVRGAGAGARGRGPGGGGK